MKIFKYLFFTLFIYFITFINVEAKSCDSSDIKRLKEVAKNVVFTYEYDYDKNKLGIYNQYNLSVNGLTDEVYAVAYKSARENSYFYFDSSSGGSATGSISSGDITFKIYSVNCDDKLLSTEKVSLPIFNVYSLDSACSDALELDVCLEFVDDMITLEEFEKAIDDYKLNKDTIIKKNFFKDNMYIFIILGCVVLVGVILIFVKKRKDNKLD